MELLSKILAKLEKLDSLEIMNARLGRLEKKIEIFDESIASLQSTLMYAKADIEYLIQQQNHYS